MTKIQLMLWNPFDLPSSSSSASELSTKTTPQILDPYRLSQCDAFKERTYTFYYQRHIFLNGTEKWDMDYRAELDGSSHAFGKTSSTGVVHLKPGSFQVQTTREKSILPGTSIFTNFIVLAAVLYTTYYALLGGRGKYRITGLAHMITRYFPQQHLERPSNTFRIVNPTADDILKVYLSGISKAKFEK
ncbi:11272_t:CDS:2 [Acaulospora morrowiae]|uniref:11272_t:CDS:1 n=1 Tax=Acaulospora morrowiae TaxID=94023 RepID=A0A9N9ASL6_9GLOM|nr:11272_t:CDS:2 [Acaulospora morrowiae]